GDASLENAVSGALLGNFYSAGEVCSNGTRVFVHRSLHAAFVERLRARVAAMRVGDPLDPATQVGALISEEHLEKVLGFIARGRAQGARLVTGGGGPPARGGGKGGVVRAPGLGGRRGRQGVRREGELGTGGEGVGGVVGGGGG